MLAFENFLVCIKLAKILSKAFLQMRGKKKKKADCFLAEHRRRIAVFSIRATKTVRTEDSKFCSCCADILNQMTSPTAWILWKVRFQWLQMKMKKQDWGTPKWKPLGWVTSTNQSTLLYPVSPVEFWVQEGRVHDRYIQKRQQIYCLQLFCVLPPNANIANKQMVCLHQWWHILGKQRHYPGTSCLILIWLCHMVAF